VTGPPPVGVPVTAINEFAKNLRAAGDAASQIAFFGAAPHLGTSAIAIKFARALAQEARVVLVALGAGDAAIKEISGDPSAPGLAELAAGKASFGDIITKDQASGLNLIVSGRVPSTPEALLAAPGMAKSFAALAHSYAHVVIDAGVLDGADVAIISGLAPHAILLVETLSGLATNKARDRLDAAGFNDVTILVAGRPDAAAPGASAKAATAAA
jgi:Mrp family chromosome partitioning ATPase